MHQKGIQVVYWTKIINQQIWRWEGSSIPTGGLSQWAQCNHMGSEKGKNNVEEREPKNW